MLVQQLGEDPTANTDQEYFYATAIPMNDGLRYRSACRTIRRAAIC